MNTSSETGDPAIARDRSWVVGVDGSECSRGAVDWATAHVTNRASSLMLVTAWQTPLTGSPAPAAPMTVPFDEEAIAGAARNTAETEVAYASSRTSVPVHAEIGHGSAAQALLEAAGSAALLVIGSRGRGGFGRLLLGSTSTQCATHSDIPVAVIRHESAHNATRSIVVAIDGSPTSLAALRWALEFADDDTTVRVVWVWDATPLAVGADEFFFPDASETAEQRFHHLIDEVTDETPDDGPALERSFIHGRPRHAIAEAAQDADLLVVGARGHGAVGSALLGSVSTWLLHHVHTPVVIVPHHDDQDTADVHPSSSG